MSRAFTKEIDDGPENDLPAINGAELPAGVKNYMTPLGHRRFVDELTDLVEVKRPEVARSAAQAAATSDALEEQTQKRNLRQTDARMQYLRRRIEQAEVVDPLKRSATDKVFFGATVLYRNSKGEERRVSIVGVDETDIAAGYISFLSPLAKALLRTSAGDTVPFQSPAGVDELEVIDVTYREIAMARFAPV